MIQKIQFEAWVCCPICIRKKSFETKMALQNHLKKKHGEKLTFTPSGRAYLNKTSGVQRAKVAIKISKNQ